LGTSAAVAGHVVRKSNHSTLSSFLEIQNVVWVQAATPYGFGDVLIARRHAAQVVHWRRCRALPRVIKRASAMFEFLRSRLISSQPPDACLKEQS